MICQCLFEPDNLATTKHNCSQNTPCDTFTQSCWSGEHSSSIRTFTRVSCRRLGSPATVWPAAAQEGKAPRQLFL